MGPSTISRNRVDCSDGRWLPDISNVISLVKRPVTAGVVKVNISPNLYLSKIVGFRVEGTLSQQNGLL